jgi:glycosyltransferase involved in cell wall biosynthesis
MKILISDVTSLLRQGGVSQFVINFIYGARTSFKDLDLYDLLGPIPAAYLPRVSVKTRFREFIRRVYLLWGVIFFKRSLSSCDFVIFNPSLNKTAMLRDLYLAELAIKNKTPFSVFIHGWDWSYVVSVDASDVLRERIVNVLQHSVITYVLCNQFRDVLTRWGVNESRVKFEYTTVNDDLLPVNHCSVSNDPLKILFLSRIIKEKGIFTALNSFKIHQNLFPSSRLYIAGAGPDLVEAMNFAEINLISNVEFVGFIDGDEKRNLLLDCDVLLFPTEYPEGMPICIFEAMAFGQVIVTRPVAGVVDYFRPEMGCIVNSTDPHDFAMALSD